MSQEPTDSQEANEAQILQLKRQLRMTQNRLRWLCIIIAFVVWNMLTLESVTAEIASLFATAGIFLIGLYVSSESPVQATPTTKE